MKRKRRRTRRNPISLRSAGAQAQALFQPALTGAAGALAVNAIINYAPLPDMLKEGRTIYLTKAALAVLLGMLGRQLPFIGRNAAAMARGALTVVLTDLGKDLALAYGGMNLSGIGYLNPGWVVSPKTPYNNGVMPNLPGRLGYYVQGRLPRPVTQSALHGVGRAGMYVNWSGRR